MTVPCDEQISYAQASQHIQTQPEGFQKRSFSGATVRNAQAGSLTTSALFSSDIEQVPRTSGSV
jgi:hypothetical protein